jgi:hypothetical protein
MAYKWPTPHIWLNDKTKTWDREKLEQVTRELASCLNDDSIFALFEDEMDADGYFAEV